MAEKTYYAWSRFRTKLNEWGQTEEEVMPGDKVTQEKLGVGDEDWQAFIDGGAIREDEYPSNLPPGVSPAQAPKPKVEEQASVKELRLNPGGGASATPTPTPTAPQPQAPASTPAPATEGKK
jgi:hypothetical protein